MAREIQTYSLYPAIRQLLPTVREHAGIGTFNASDRAVKWGGYILSGPTLEIPSRDFTHDLTPAVYDSMCKLLAARGQPLTGQELVGEEASAAGVRSRAFRIRNELSPHGALLKTLKGHGRYVLLRADVP